MPVPLGENACEGVGGAAVGGPAAGVVSWSCMSLTFFSIYLVTLGDDQKRPARQSVHRDSRQLPQTHLIKSFTSSNLLETPSGHDRTPAARACAQKIKGHDFAAEAGGERNIQLCV